MAKDGEDLIFYIRIHTSELSDLFRPFIWAGSLQRPQIKKASDPASSLAFRQFMAHEQVRRHTSLTPSSNSHKQWVESNRSVLTEMTDLMAEVQKDDRHRVPILHIDIISSNTGVSQYLRAPVIQWHSSQRSSSDLRSLLKPTVGQSALTGERDARSAAYLFWVIIQPVLLSSDLNEIMQNTVVALKREGKQTFSSLASGQQGALQFALKPLRNVFARALVKAYAFKHRLCLEELGTLRPFPIYDVLLSSSLICPGLFPDSAWDEATNLLRQSMDSPSLRTWDNKAPPFNAPPPPARTRSFRDPLPSPSPRPPRQYNTLWRTDTSGARNPRHTSNRDGSTTQAFRGRGARSARGHSSQPPGPLPTLLPSANPPHTAATPEAGQTPAAKTTPAIIPAALDPGVAPAPPPPVEVDSPADLSRSGGRLTFFAPAWVAAPQSIRTIVSRGFHWTWLDQPPRLRPPTFTQSLPDLSLPVQDWVTKGVIYPVPHQPCFQSRIFTVPRPDGRPPRIIIDLSPLNPFILAPQFRLDNHSTLAQVLPPPAHMASLDISEAYTHIPIRNNLHRYLAFSFNSQLYFFRALPFGLNVAPFIFTKVLDWPLRTLRIQGINVLAYLDDIVLWHPSPVILHQHVARAVERLSVMGFRVNLPKSQLEPQTSLQWLGILWHSQTGQWQATQSIRDKIQSSTHQLLQQGRITRRRLEALVGLINFACQVHSHLRVYLQPLTVGASLASPQDRDVSRPISPTLRQALQFWTDPHIWDYVPPFQVTLPRLYLWTDASRSGWGALLHPQATAHALWGPLEAAVHINVLELRAVSRAITTFNLSSCHLVVYTDNETVRFALTHLRTRSLPLREELKALLHDTVRRQVFVHPLRIPTTLNVVADGLSRLEPLNTEWTLPPEAFQAIVRWAGPLQVDLLASPTNYRLPQWVSLFPHPDAVACNCLSFDWNGFASIYAFPPVGLIPTLLPLIRGYRGRLVLVAPWDPHAPWLPFLLQHARDHLHLRTTPFQLCGRGQVFHRLGTSARWTAFLFCVEHS